MDTKYLSIRKYLHIDVNHFGVDQNHSEFNFWKGKCELKFALSINFKGYKKMDMTKIAEYARALYEAHGGKAEVEAAQKAKQSEEAGNSKEAETWRAVREAISEMRGAPES